MCWCWTSSFPLEPPHQRSDFTASSLFNDIVIFQSLSRLRTPLASSVLDDFINRLVTAHSAPPSSASDIFRGLRQCISVPWTLVYCPTLLEHISSMWIIFKMKSLSLHWKHKSTYRSYFKAWREEDSWLKWLRCCMDQNICSSRKQRLPRHSLLQEKCAFILMAWWCWSYKYLLAVSPENGLHQ